jgi:glycosyltransferase involved in cell wall biosynthesis
VATAEGVRPLKTFSVSVVIPCRDGGRYVEEAVRSALAQIGPFDLVEVIVVDDRSEDPATREAYGAIARMAKASVIANEGRRGNAATRNAGIRRAKGDWIAFLDADDIWPDGSLACRMAALADVPEADWIGANWSLIDAEGRPIPVAPGEDVRSRGMRHPPSREHERAVGEALRTGRPMLYRRPLDMFRPHRCPIMTSVMIARRSLLVDVGMFEEDLLAAPDSHLFAKLAATGDFLFVPQVALHYRRHGTQVSNNEDRSRAYTRLYTAKLAHDPVMRDHRALMRAWFTDLCVAHCYHYRSKGRFLKAAGIACSGLARAPANRRTWKALAGALLRRP